MNRSDDQRLFKECATLLQHGTIAQICARTEWHPSDMIKHWRTARLGIWGIQPDGWSARVRLPNAPG